MSLLKLASKENVVSATPDPHALEINEFKKVYEEEDKPERIFAYIYNRHNPDSNYFNHSENMREKELKKDLFGDENYTLSDAAKEAEQKYIEITRTPEQKLLEKAVNSVYKLIDYLDAFDPTERDDKGRLMWSTKDYIKNMEKLGGVVDSLEDLRDRVRKGEEAQGKTIGGVKRTKYNK